MKLIALEGIDASGKETQAKLLTNYLKEKGYKVHLETFPRYDTEIGNLIKRWLYKEIEITEEAVRLLYEADRMDFNARLKELEVEGYDFVVLDRYVMSNLAFGYAKGIDVDWLLDVQKPLIKPDITFVISISVEESFKRRGEGRDRYETDRIYLQNVVHGYGYVANLTEVGKVVFVNGEVVDEKVHGTITYWLDVLNIC